MRSHGLPALPRPGKAPKPAAVPASMAGQYVIWSPDGLRISGHGKTIAEARDMAGGGRGDGRVIRKIPAVRRFRPANGMVIGAGDAKGPGPAGDPAKV